MTKAETIKSCCAAFKSYLEKTNIVKYESYTRSFLITVQPDDSKSFYITTRLKFCPFCGTKLPKNLYDEWSSIVETEFNENIFDKEGLKERLPKEYMSEEWWKKRGL